MLNDGFARDQILATVTTHQCKFAAHTLLHWHRLLKACDHYNIYCNVVEMMPRLPDEIQKAGPEGTATLAKFVRKWGPPYSSAHYVSFSDREWSQECPWHWCPWFQNKHSPLAQFEPEYEVDAPQKRGFYNLTCGLLLCPGVWIGVMMGKLTLPLVAHTDSLRVSRVRRGLRDGTTKVKPDDFPCLLYRHETINQEDLFDGFLRNQLLVKVCKAYYIDTNIDLSCSRDTSTFFLVQALQTRWERNITS